MVSRSSCYDDQFDFFRAYACVSQSTFCRNNGHIGCSFAFSGNMPVFNACTFNDPLVAGFYYFFKIMVGQHLFRHIAAQT